MSRSALALSLAFLLPVTAGGAAAAGGGADTLGSLEDFSRAVGMKPGGWRVSMKAVSAQFESAPGADPANLAALKAEIEPQIGTVEEVDECIDPASTESTRLPGILVERGCTYSRLEAADGRWAMTATCPTPRKDGIVTLAGEGTYSPESVTSRHQARIRIRGVIVNIEAETVSRFVGECRPPVPITLVPEPGKN